MNKDTEREIIDHLESIYSAPCCLWCKHPFESIYRAKLCRHCYNIRSEVRRLKKLPSEYVCQGKTVPPAYEWMMKVAFRMGYLAQLEGELYGELHKRTITGIDLEYAFRRLSGLLIKDEGLFFHYANLFDWDFSPAQKRLLFHLMAILQRKYDRKRRRLQAYYCSIPEYIDLENLV